MQRCVAKMLELRDQVGHAHAREWSIRNVRVFIEARHRRLVRSRKSECAILKYPLPVRQVTDNLTWRPLPGCIREIEARLGNRSEKREHLAGLPVECLYDVAVRHLVDVRRVISDV